MSPLVKRYKTTYIAYSPPSRLEADVPASLHPAHRVGYKQRRDITQSKPQNTTYQARCSCGAKDDGSQWYPTKPRARKAWFKPHLNECQIQRTFPGTEETTLQHLLGDSNG